MLGWALFYFEDLGELSSFFGRLFSFDATGSAGLQLILGYLPMLAVCFLAATPLLSRIGARWQETALVRYGKLALCALVLLLCVASLVSTSYNPFIYFRF